MQRSEWWLLVFIGAHSLKHFSMHAHGEKCSLFTYPGKKDNSAISDVWRRWLFANCELCQFPLSLIVKVIFATFMGASTQPVQFSANQKPVLTISRKTRKNEFKLVWVYRKINQESFRPISNTNGPLVPSRLMRVMGAVGQTEFENEAYEVSLTHVSAACNATAIALHQ